MTTQTMLKPDQVKHDAMSENLGPHEHIAVDGAGRVVARADSREAVEQAAPHHSGIFSAKDFKGQHEAEPINNTGAPVGAEATAQPSNNSYEKILAHVEKTRDSEGNHERQLHNAEKVIAEDEANKPEGTKKAEAKAAEAHPKRDPASEAPKSKTSTQHRNKQ